MDFPMARISAEFLAVVDSVDSTNAELARRVRDRPLPHFSALATLDQQQGRGRLGRTWASPPGASLAVSVSIRVGAVPADRLGALPLLGGLAAQAAVAAELPGSAVTVKWPNDVLVGERKIAGVLAEAVPGTDAVILGVGINTAMTTDQLPVPTATSIAIESGTDAPPAELADRVLAAFLRALTGLVDRFLLAHGDLERSGLHADVEAACATIGAQVLVQRPGGIELRGMAVGLGADGALLVDDGGSHGPTAIHAGDVTHLRYQ